MFGLDKIGLLPDLSGLFKVESREEVAQKIKTENPSLSGVQLEQAIMEYDMKTYGGIRIGDFIVDPNFVGSLAKVGGKAAISLTLKTLDRMASEIKQPEVARETIEQYLSRPGVGKQEQTVIRNVLDIMDPRNIYHTSLNKIKSLESNPMFFALDESAAKDGWFANAVQEGNKPTLYKSNMPSKIASIQDKEVVDLFKKNNINVEDYMADLASNPTSEEILSYPATKLLQDNGYQGLKVTDYDPRDVSKDLDSLLIFDPKKSLSSFDEAGKSPTEMTFKLPKEMKAFYEQAKFTRNFEDFKAYITGNAGVNPSKAVEKGMKAPEFRDVFGKELYTFWHYAKSGELPKGPVNSLFQNKVGTAKIKVGEFVDNVRMNLLPLKTKTTSNRTPKVDLDRMSDEDFENLASGNATRYDGINLPSELKVPTKNYTENIYESPIKTSAGSVHFKGLSEVEDPQNYFAHTRTEDLVGNLKDEAGNIISSDVKTRRILEVQSDLFQKGRLEREIGDELNGDTIEGRMRHLEGIKGTTIDPTPTERSIARAKELTKLKPYENIWYERIIREETKRAAQDGQLKIQVPTGETAMKIEGLSARNLWRTTRDYQGDIQLADTLTPDKLEIEMRVGRDGMNGDWIVTDVLGDGKFKAMPDGFFKLVKTAIQKNPEFQNLTLQQQIKKLDEKGWDINARQETFDISGKVDTNNPIYQYYESKVGNFVRKEYGAKLVTDAKGVTWFEYDIPEGTGKSPVKAFGAGFLGLGELKEEIFGTKTLTSEDDSATYETKVPGMVRSLMGDNVEYKKTNKNKFIPLTEKEEPMFTPSEVTPKIVDAIAFNESRGVPEEERYIYRKFSGEEAMGDDTGKYQITEGELAAYSEKFLGFKVGAGVFQNNPEWQDIYIRNKVAFLENEGLDIHEILALHRYGMTGWGNPVKVREKVLKAAEYIESAQNFMKGQVSE